MVFVLYYFNCYKSDQITLNLIPTSYKIYFSCRSNSINTTVCIIVCFLSVVDYEICLQQLLFENHTSYLSATPPPHLLKTSNQF